MNPDTLAPGERGASTSNRNFEGRQGRGGRTHLVSPQMAAAVLCIFAIALSASYLAAKPPRRPCAGLEFFNAAVAALFLNACQHAAQTLVMRKYTPGVVTAVTVSLPYSV